MYAHDGMHDGEYMMIKKNAKEFIGIQIAQV